jgi:competence ComEA-like helix-hairpin-helix protein
MWKDYFYFSKVQRTGIIVLLSFIVLVFLANIILPHLVKKENEKPVLLQQEAAEFKKQMISIDSLRKAEYEKKIAEKYYTHFDKETYNEAYSLFSFDPNKTDSTTFVRLGLKKYVIANIMKFRKKGGYFKTAESFSKVYGLQPEKFKELEPFISISENAKPAQEASNQTLKTETMESPIVVELNEADTTELMKVKGIGRGYAKGIIRFRKATGGFASVDQLKEIYGMTEENFQKIKPYCIVNLRLIRKINVNTASVDKLNTHPYINFYQAKAIYELRRKKIRLKSIEELTNLTEFSQESLQKINPYLSFD